MTDSQDTKRQKRVHVPKAMDDVQAVAALRKLLTFRTVSSTGHTDGSNHQCVEYLAELCHAAGMTTETLRGPIADGTKPILVAKWAGSDPSSTPAVLLNSHYDVVPVLTSHWTKPAWDGLRETIDGEDRIYGRGAQDMKLVPIQYIVAVSRLSATGVQPKQDVYLTFVPDEEVGGSGMSWFIQCDFYKKHMEGKLGCAFDEGLANTEDAFTVFYGERTPWWVIVDANGPTGHGSRFIKGTATHALHAFTQRALAFRKEQEAKLLPPKSAEGGCDHAKHHKLGDVTTVNLTMQRAGVSMDGGATYAINVIPTEASAGFDVRVPVTMPHAELEATFTRWCREAEVETQAAEGTLSWKFAPYGGDPLKSHHTTSVDPKESPYWKTFLAAVQDTMGICVCVCCALVSVSLSVLTSVLFLCRFERRSRCSSPFRVNMLLCDSSRVALCVVFCCGCMCRCI
eukprot:m.26712 g.26712  ORF g.26712 m.26712 type:complete len:455 (-) comp13377_c0_seq2:2072-3436(-)